MSNTNDQQTYLLETISKQIERTDLSRVFYRTRAFRLFMSVSIISALTTILLGLNIPDLKEFVRITALILTTITTIINAYNAFFGHKELWISYNLANNRLKHLKLDIEFGLKSNDPLPSDQLVDFKKSFQDILDELNASWQKNRQGDKNK